MTDRQKNMDVKNKFDRKDNVLQMECDQIGMYDRMDKLKSKMELIEMIVWKRYK